MENTLEESAQDVARGVISVAKETAETLLGEQREVKKQDHAELIFVLKKYFEDNDRLLKGHFDDDKKSFAAIQEHLKRREKLAVIHAEHFSAMGKELAVMNGTLTELKPILDEYKSDQITKATIARYSDKVVKAVKVVSVIAAAIASTWAAIKGFLLFVIK